MITSKAFIDEIKVYGGSQAPLTIGDRPLFPFACIYNGNLAILTCWVVEWSLGSLVIVSAIHSTRFMLWSGVEKNIR